jgi:fucose permease
MQKMGQIIRDPVVLLTSVFAFLYVGTEITIGGWIVTFLRTVRGAGPSAGYVSTGFFAGLTLGRVLHVWLARVVQERYALFGYGAIAIALQIVSETEIARVLDS